MSSDVEQRKLSEAELDSQRHLALGQMAFARQYLMGLIEKVPHDEWKITPGGAPSSIAWQLAHLSVAQYGLMLFRQRGRADGDMELMPSWLRKKFGRGSTPPLDPAELPDPQELLTLMDRIHTTSMSVVVSLPAAQFADPTDMPYAVYPNKLGALLFCPLHESIHIGQIGLIRRLLGKQPVR